MEFGLPLGFLLRKCTLEVHERECSGANGGAPHDAGNNNQSVEGSTRRQQVDRQEKQDVRGFIR
jgi:hypothetical protein